MIVIGGATATGKSALAIEIAKRLDGEIIGADSMQIYKYMDVGTAKPTKEEMCGIPHYMIDVVEPNENFSVAEYKKKAEIIIENVKKRNKVPIIVGGTGLYVNALVYDYSPFAFDDKLKQELRQELEEKGVDYMYDKLCCLDPKAVGVIHKNNSKRVLRAIEVKILTGQSLVGKRDKEFTVPSLVYVLGGANREELYEKINFRVDVMFENGLCEEIDRLIKGGKVDFSCQSMQAIGYKEFAPLYAGEEITLDVIKEKIKQHTRNYAKRQITWFKSINTATWFTNESFEEKVDRIVGDYSNFFAKL